MRPKIKNNLEFHPMNHFIYFYYCVGNLCFKKRNGTSTQTIVYLRGKSIFLS